MSGRQQGESRTGKRKGSAKATGEGKGRRQRASDIGRALRTIYDDTLRESVPDDFLKLLGKLS